MTEGYQDTKFDGIAYPAVTCAWWGAGHVAGHWWSVVSLSWSFARWESGVWRYCPVHYWLQMSSHYVNASEDTQAEMSERCFFQWISLLWCRDLQTELSEQVNGRDSTSTDLSGREKSRNRDMLAMCFALHRKSNLLSDFEMHHEQHVRKCCCFKQCHVIRMWQQFSFWCHGFQSEQ